jgi:hypothetical protein
MGHCVSCGNDYDKTFDVHKDGDRNTPSTASSAPFIGLHPHASTAAAACSAMASRSKEASTAERAVRARWGGRIFVIEATSRWSKCPITGDVADGARPLTIADSLSPSP